MTLRPKDYSEARKISCLFQGILGVFSSMVLDNGLCFGIFINSMVAYWVSYVIITRRRPHSPSNMDLYFIAWGFLVICIVIAPVVSMIGLKLIFRYVMHME